MAKKKVAKKAATKKAATKKKAAKKAGTDESESSSTMGRALLRYFRTRSRRLELEQLVKEQKKVEQELQGSIVHMMNEQRIDKVTSRAGTLSKRIMRVNRADDWGKVYEWVVETGNVEILQKRFNQSFIDELIAEGGVSEIPGTKIEQVVKVTATAARV